MSQLDSQASRVALGESSTQRVELGFIGSDGSLRTLPDSGWIRVQLVDAMNGTTETVVDKTSLGAMTYDHGETTVAYQGGGVWRRDGDSSVMLSRPEFHYRNKTLSLPIIKTRGERSLYSGVELTGTGQAVRRFPNETAGWGNRVEGKTVEITVKSEYYDGWGQFFETTTNGVVTYHHSNDSVTVKFFSVPSAIRVSDGVIATSGPGRIELAGTGAYVNSYNSTAGGYAATESSNGSIRAAGDVNMTGDAAIDGDVSSGASVTISNANGEINGDVYYTEEYRNNGEVDGNVSRINGVEQLEPIDPVLDWRVRSLRAANDNSRTSAIENSRLSIDGSEAEISSGAYYFEKLNLDGETLVLNATEGDITIGVRDWIKLNRSHGTGGNLTVKGDGSVHVFVLGDDEVTAQITGQGSREVNFHVGKDSTVHVPDEHSRQFVLYGKQDMRATIAGSNGKESSFDGVIYAPAGEYGSGDTYVKQANVYGALVTGNLTLGNKGKVHFDRGLADEPIGLSPGVSRFEFLYVTEHEFRASPR